MALGDKALSLQLSLEAAEAAASNGHKRAVIPQISAAPDR